MKSGASFWFSPVVLGVALAALLLPAGPLQASAPAAEAAAAATGGWASSWMPIAPGTALALTHNLGGDPDDYAIQLWFRESADGIGIHNRGYGGDEFGDPSQYRGAFWQQLTGQSITVVRMADDLLVEEVRVWVWVPDPLPDYCSPWTDLPPGQTQDLNHGLGGDVSDYVVGLQFKDTVGANPVGINQRAFGGMEVNGTSVGAFWHHLTNSSVQVTRMGADPFADQVKLCITLPDPPDYDSGWVDRSLTGLQQLEHDLGGNLNSYVIRTEFKDTQAGGLGIHHRHAGGQIDVAQQVGAWWQNLTSTAIELAWFPNDTQADQVRVRIWQREPPVNRVYLPFVWSTLDLAGR